MNALLIVVLCIVGIVLNFWVLNRAADKEPTGAMGMGMFYILGILAPFFVAALFLLFGIIEKVIELVKRIRR